MTALFASGHVVDILLGFMAVEALALVLWHRRTGGGLAPADVATFLLSGVFLMLALRCALVGAWWGWTGLCLALGGLAHGADLWRRWRVSRALWSGRQGATPPPSPPARGGGSNTGGR